jgi:hypothetical protein
VVANPVVAPVVSGPVVPGPVVSGPVVPGPVVPGPVVPGTAVTDPASGAMAPRSLSAVSSAMTPDAAGHGPVLPDAPVARPAGRPADSGWGWLRRAAEMAALAGGLPPAGRSAASGQDRPCYPRIAMRTASLEPGSISAARKFTALIMQRWGAADRSADASVVVSELLSNAVRHGLPPASTAPGSTRPGSTAPGSTALEGAASRGAWPAGGAAGPMPPGRAVLASAELGPAELDPAALAPAELAPAELAPAELGAADLGAAELVTAACPGPHAVRLGLLYSGCCVLCAVTDLSDQPPVPRAPDGLDEGGRGLHVVAALSDSWGCCPGDPGEAGKVVWATFLTAP